MIQRASARGALHFTVVTLTTVGYGDLHPTSDASRLFTAIFILAGVGVAISALGILGSAYLNRRTQQILERKDETNQEGGT